MTGQYPDNRKRLYRSRDDVVIFGVCGGLSKYFDLNPRGVRLVWLLLSVFAAPATLATYLALALLMKPEPLGWPDAPGMTGHDAGWNETALSNRDLLRHLSQRAAVLDERIRRMESVITRPGFGI